MKQVFAHLSANAADLAFSVAFFLICYLIARLLKVAPPAALGVLRKALDRQVANHVIAEIGKDLTNQPVPDIERALIG